MVSYVNRFQTRKAAADFAKKNDAKIERCPYTGTNRNGFFKYQVIITGEEKK